jgi:hypothetical protein
VEDLVDTGNAAAELMPGVEDGGVCVGNLGATREDGFNRRRTVLCILHGLEEFNGAPSPYGPLSQQAANKVSGTLTKAKLCEKVSDDIVVISGIEGDFRAASAVCNRAEHFHGLIPVERRDLYGNDRLDFDEAFPEVSVERATADGRLQIKAHEGDGLSDGTAVLDERIVGRIRESGEAEQPSVVADSLKDSGFLTRLPGIPTDATDFSQDFSRAFFKGPHLFEGEFEDGLKEADFGVADGELSGVYANGHAAAASVAIVAGEGALASLIEL